MNKYYCFGCGAEKDITVLEISPSAEEDGLCDELITPLHILDCQGPIILNDTNGYSEYRMTAVCNICFHALSPDMWISKSCWESINPKIPYDKLPMYNQELAIKGDVTLIKALYI